MKISTAILSVMLIAATVGCGDSDSTPTTPSTSTPPPPAAPVQLAMFTDPASSFSTSDVRDSEVGDRALRHRDQFADLAADGRSFSGYPVSGLFIIADRFFQVRFGTKDGERRACFTEAAAGTICDVEIVGGQLQITSTTVTVPGSGTRRVTTIMMRSPDGRVLQTFDHAPRR